MLATESDRLNYLSALGLTQYRARSPLPGAAASLRLQVVSVADLSSHAAAANVDTSAEAQSPISASAAIAPAPPQAAPPMKHAATAAANAIAALQAPNAAPALAEATPSADLPTAVAQTESETSTTTSAATPANKAQTIPFHCQLALWQQDELFILADVAQLQADQVQLLKNILSACGRKPQLTSPQQFSWPLAKRRNSDFNEAREHFLGLLDASLANSPVQQLWCFGPQALRLLTNDHDVAELLANSDCEKQALNASLHAINFAHRWPLTALPSLSQMLQEPSRYKPLAWQLLQSRIPS